jgi:hypothetical protein
MVEKRDQLHDIVFDEDFFKLPVAAPVRICIAIAERAQRVSENAPPQHVDAYLKIAQEWLRLAHDMERAD